MKLLLAFALAVFTASPLFAYDHSAIDQVLRTYVNGKGLVNYSQLKSNRAGLDGYLKKTGAVSKSTFDSWSRDEQLAFLINVYNAETLQLIIDHYPTSSIKKIGGLLNSPWKLKVVTLFGKETTLDHLEHEIIRVDYPDEPRIHFALVCAAVGCPPLRNEAYAASQLNAQLQEQAKTFLNDSQKNRIEGGTLYLSPIFDWYGKDFTKTGKSLSEAVDPWINGSAKGKEIKFTDYDWSLNKQ